MSSENRTIRLPRPEEPSAPHPFPILATIAPVVASVALYVVTRSPFALIFALLGPVVAVASLGDARRQARRHGRAEFVRFQRELVHARQKIRGAQEEEIARRDVLAPTATLLLGDRRDAPERWTKRLEENLPIVLGRGPSALNLIAERELEEVQENPELVELGAEANTIASAPVLVDARHGIAILGPPAQALAVLNGIAMQLANALAPDEALISVGINPALDWIESLPHPQAGRTSGGQNALVEFRHCDSLQTVTVAAVKSLADAPRSCRIIIRIGGGDGAEIIRNPDHSRYRLFEPEFVSSAQAKTFARALADAARVNGLTTRASLPARVDFSDLERATTASSGSLSCALGLGEDGPIMVDLVKDGPHAVVGGTTGSGKSELLVSWVLGIAATASPTEVTFLLVDFKGGASFSAITDLPHCLGVVTDLDESGAQRALASLTSEIRRRERVLGDRAAASIDALHPAASLPRLVIVIDEFATVTASFPDLHHVFADIAARGRSLGIHLILCTQRPAGVVRDAVLANCALRVSLRVNNPADSVAVIGSPDAAELSRRDPGRAIIATGDGAPMTVQIAKATPADAQAIARHWSSEATQASAWRPWRAPLAHMIRPADLSGFFDDPEESGIAFGVLDRPAAQSQDVARYDPDSHGSMLIVGGRQSGKSLALSAIGAQSSLPRRAAVQIKATKVPADIEGAWDGVIDALDAVRAGTCSNQLFLIDDVDVLLGRLGNDYSVAMVENVVALIREGKACGVHLVLAASRISGQLHTLAEVCESTLVLRVAELQDHLAAGGTRESFDPSLPQGGGLWRRERIQVVCVDPAGIVPPTRPPLLLVPSRLAVVAHTPLAIMSRLEPLGSVTLLGAGRPTDWSTDRLDVSVVLNGTKSIILGDPDAWQADWALLASLRASVPIAFFGCSPSQFRSIAPSSALPPPLASPAEAMVLLAPNGAMSRVRIPDH
ncbi:MAG: FtsK/SpoIIIE domain-containing protein [Terrimesophilobacter sp.]